MRAALAIDLGGTNFRAALAFDGHEGDAVAFGQWPAPPDLETFQRRIATLIEERAVSRIGVGIPGLATGTTCVWVPNLPYLNSRDLALMFPGIAVALGNDAQLALLAEATLGAVRDIADAILLAIGTGIGSAVLADGRIVRGAGGAAASFGWACADPSDSGDEVHGWLERNAAGPAFDAIAKRAGLADGRALIAAARGGDRGAAAGLEAPAAALGAALAGAAALLGSQRVVVSGGLAEGVDVLAPLILDVLRRQLPPHLRAIALIPAHFSARASLVGAGLAALGHPLWQGRRP